MNDPDVYKRLEEIKLIVITEARNRGLPTDGSPIYREVTGMERVYPVDMADFDLLSALIFVNNALDSARVAPDREEYVKAVLLGFDLARLYVASGADKGLGKAAVTGLALQKSGYERARKHHGATSAEDISAWQASMDRVCREKPGLGKQKVWEEVEKLTGSKKETMEKYGVICPIAGKRGPKRKLPPQV